MSDLRVITTCAGIGDFIWLAMKLINAKEKFHVVLPDGSPKRGHQILDLLPQIVESHEYAPGLTYKIINSNNAQREKKQWSKIIAKSFYLSANNHLEEGRRIEGWLPDLPITYKLEYATTETDKLTTEALLKEDRPYIGIYTSAYSNSRHWNGWGVEEWFKLIRFLHKKNIAFVFIGASYDIGITQEIIKQCDELGVSYVDTIGQPLSVVIEVLKRLNYFLGFPSGLSILNESLGKGGTMFYPMHLKPMMNAWADPARIEAGNYKGCQFCPPEKIFDWLKLEYKIFDKL